jgi:hypothetical protein
VVNRLQRGARLAASFHILLLYGIRELLPATVSTIVILARDPFIVDLRHEKRVLFSILLGS